MARGDLLIRAHRTGRSALPEGISAEALASVRFKPAAQFWPQRHNTGRVNILVGDVIVALDLLEIDRVAKTRSLEQVARVAPEVFHLDKPIAIRFEMPVVDGVEADERREEPYVGLG